MALTQVYAPKPQVRIVHSNLCFDKGLAEVIGAGATGLASLAEVTLERANMVNGHQLYGRIREGVLAASFMGSPQYALVRDGFPGLNLEYAERATNENKNNSWFLVGDSCYKQDRERATVSGECEVIDSRDLVENRLAIPFDVSNRYSRFMLGGKGTEEEVTARTQACIDYFKGQKKPLQSLNLYVPNAKEVVDSKDIIATQFWANVLDRGFLLGGDDRGLGGDIGVFGCVR